MKSTDYPFHSGNYIQVAWFDNLKPKAEDFHAAKRTVFMSEAPKSLLKLASTLYKDQSQKEAFITSLMQGKRSHPALIWLKDKPGVLSFELEAALGFEPDFVSRVKAGEKPGSHPLHSEGYYYCLDFSSVFAASILQGLQIKVNSVLDMCASPGGKSVFAWRLLKPEYLVCNEVIGKRHAALISNLDRLKIPSYVTRHDSSKFEEFSPHTFDLVICDVPCSGQSLVARGKESGGAFHPSTINMNSNRQKRIIANSLKVVAPGGYLAYMTCTFSRPENEAVIEWALKKFPEFEALECPKLSEFTSTFSDFPSYRLMPQSEIGAGAFACLLRSKSQSERNVFKIENLPLVWSCAAAEG